MNETSIKNTTAPAQAMQRLTIQDIWSICIRRWPWFVLSVVVCVAAAALYILKTPPVYTRSAAVLIKEDAKGRSISNDVQSSFSDLGLVASNVNVNNEIISFSSPDLMIEVVKRLHLETDYKLEHRFYDRTLYGSTLPLTVSFLDLGNSDAAKLDIAPEKSGGFLLTNFHLNGDDAEKGTVVKAALGDTLSTPLGRILLSESPYQGVAPLSSTLHVYHSNANWAAKFFVGNLSVTLASKQATVIDLSINDVNTQRAMEILSMLINVYNEMWIKDKNQITTSTNEFIAERLQVIEAELGSVDNSISTYKSVHRLPDIGASATMDMQVSMEAGRQITELNNQLSIARYLLSYIRDSWGKLLPADAGLRESSIQNMINQYNTTLLQRNRLVESSSEENYLVKDLDQQLESMRGAILTSIDNYIVGLNNQLSSSRAAQASADARISSNPQQAGELLSDERQQMVKESLYLFLLQKREENELSQAFTAYNTRVVSEPGGSNVPISPEKKKIFLIALLLGLALPLGIIYLQEVSNTTVRGREDIKKMAAPFVGELPSVEPKKGLFHKAKVEERKILVKPHSRDVINEAFRVVRTNVEFMRGKGDGGYIIMTTSMNPGSGKTFITSNLAMAFAIKGKKTIALDLDLRKRSLSSLVDNPKLGIADYLNGREDDFASLIVRNVNQSGLDILPVGTLPPNPAELLSEERLDALASTLRRQYDYIFLDCPPVEIVTDADIINRLADLTVFIARAGLLERSMLAEIDRFYTTKKYTNVAVLLNGTDGGSHYGYKYGYKYGYGYGHSYGYGYGHYGYGYGDDGEKKEGKKKTA